MAESSAQQEQLQALYDDVARVRGDARLAEVERAITLANQHLAVSGNVKGALLALEGAEKQLADSEQSQAIGLRRVILQDIEKLKSLPEVDLVRSVARMDAPSNFEPFIFIFTDLTAVASWLSSPST